MKYFYLNFFFKFLKEYLKCINLLVLRKIRYKKFLQNIKDYFIYLFLLINLHKYPLFFKDLNI